MGHIAWVRFGERRPAHHAAGLAVWICVGAIYNFIIWTHLGKEKGQMWLDGWILEFFFSIENVFVYRVIAERIQATQMDIVRALSVVVFGQIAFECTFFMGMAGWLRSIAAIPYILGTCLVYAGSTSLLWEDTGHDVIDNGYTKAPWTPLSWAKQKVGSSLGESHFFGKPVLTQYGMFILSLLLSCFFLEIDVVIAKIEQLDDPYIAFSSSAVAAFAVPELFFVTDVLFKRFFLLHYGLGLVLTFFGAILLLEDVFQLSALVECAVIVSIILLCIIMSVLISSFNSWYRAEPHEEDS